MRMINNEAANTVNDDYIRPTATVQLFLGLSICRGVGLFYWLGWVRKQMVDHSCFKRSDNSMWDLSGINYGQGSPGVLRLNCRGFASLAHTETSINHCGRGYILHWSSFKFASECGPPLFDSSVLLVTRHDWVQGEPEETCWRVSGSTQSAFPGPLGYCYQHGGQQWQPYEGETSKFSNGWLCLPNIVVACGWHIT